MEGTFGAIMMIVIVLPAVYVIPGSDYGGRYENAFNAMAQIRMPFRRRVRCPLSFILLVFRKQRHTAGHGFVVPVVHLHVQSGGYVSLCFVRLCLCFV